ncbi:MAG: hypothetical protein DRQ01_08755 [Ignavibacteriae bacterium]|nr:MAG: hypothetical protein DRQ01_08755 [Ignavibacteriota bacterium]
MLIAASILTGCGKEQPKTEYVARVNDAYFTKKELASLIDTTMVNTLHKSEVIRNWINREILFQKAKNEGILQQDDYKGLIKKSGKELAGALLLDNYISSVTINFEQRDLIIYFEENSNDFKLPDKSYLLNIIHFGNEDKAVEFRSLVLDSDWQKAMNIFYGDSEIISTEKKVLLKERDIYSIKVLRVVKRLHPLEISIVISEREGYYTVVQVLEKYLEGSLPSFDLIKLDVEKRFVADKRKELMENYMKDLYSKNEIEVIN